MAAPRCLYEILGVERTASNEEIRSAYRKLALKWHPDKIQQSGACADACEEAKIQFQEIGRAYEVLADPSERSWYDSHRCQILSSSSSSASDFDFNPWPYFSPSAFSGYGDTGKGFYAVYGDIFTKLHQQEQLFARSYGLKPPFDPTDMGSLDTPYPQVQKFYNHWLGFTTVKDFAWCDEYRASDGPNRKLRRLMEEENKKIRAKARKEFNEAIRRLAAFVKKRDKRVLERQIEMQRLEKEKEELQMARRKKAEEEKKMKARLYEEAEWTKVSNAENDANDSSDFDDSIGSYDWGPSTAKSNGDKNDRQDEFFCIVCNKKFKSDKQWRNHERSKKHLERVAILKESFDEEDKEFEIIRNGMLEDGHLEVRIAPESESVSASDVDDTEVFGEEKAKASTSAAPQATDTAWEDETQVNADQSSEKPTKEGEKSINESDSNNADSEVEKDDNDEFSSLLTMVSSYTNRQQQKINEDSDGVPANWQNVSNAEDEDEGDEEMLLAMLKFHQSPQQPESDEDPVEEAESSSTLAIDEDRDDKSGYMLKKKKTKGRLRNEKQQAATSNRHSTLLEEFSRGKEMDMSPTTECETAEVNEQSAPCNDESVQESAVPDKDEPPVNKRSQTTTRRQANGGQGIKLPKDHSLHGHVIPETQQSRKLAKGKKSKGNVKSAANTCETCGEDFETRNQLFKHISATKHAVLRK